MVSIKKILVILIVLFPVLVFAKTDTVSFYKCMDGDTFKVKRNDEIITIRLLAVDTPESVKQNSPVEYYGPEASDYTCNIISKAKKIELEYDDNSDEKDKYDRYLAWVFVDDELLQDKLVSNGYAEVAYLYDNYKYADLLKDHENIAKAKKIGMWNEETVNKIDKTISDYSLFISICISLIVILFASIKNKLKKIFNKSKI